jgi:hypothetical protein
MFKKLLAKQDFNSGFLGIFTNPFYFARKKLLTVPFVWDEHET